MTFNAFNLSIIEKLFLLYLLLKPYYLFNSGGLQIADILIVLAFIIYLFYTKFKKSFRSNLANSMVDNKYIVYFVFCVVLINASYYLIYGNSKFLMASLYYVFTLIFILQFSIYVKNRQFLKSISNVLKFNLIIQLAIYIVGVGRYYTPDRYMGTFNDPNQFGFYVFISFLIIYAINMIIKTNDRITPFLIIASFLIYLSSSTGALFGLLVFLIGEIIASLYRFRFNYRIYRNIIYTITSLIILLGMSYIAYTSISTSRETGNISSAISELPISQRLQQKNEKIQGESDVSIWQDRGLDKIVNFPHYIIFGAGEGAYERFHNTWFIGEVHSTLPSIIFYYGIIPFTLLIIWLSKKLKNLTIELYVVIVALLAESFILLNQRQSLFWVLIIIIATYTYYKNSSTSQERI